MRAWGPGRLRAQHPVTRSAVSDPGLATLLP
jgi:hypothetical protein